MPRGERGNPRASPALPFRPTVRGSESEKTGGEWGWKTAGEPASVGAVSEATASNSAAWSVLLHWLEQEKQHGETHVWLSPEARTVMREWHASLRGGPAARPGAKPAAPTRVAAAAPAATTAAVTAAAAPRPSVPPEEVIRSLFSPVPGSTKAAELAPVRQAVLECPHYADAIARGTLRETMVFSVGNVDSPLVFVGEAPGAEEEKAGEPFVGPAGQLLTRIISAMGLRREQVYITNIVKYRPSTGAGQGASNRKPSAEEIAVGLPHLVRELEVMKPRVIVALGGTALEGLTGKAGSISAQRGRWIAFRGTPLMPTFHPSFLLRNEGLTDRRKVWEDMMQVMEKLGLPISEKQKRFFLVAG